MKKYIVTLAAMALAIGGTINLTGCSGTADDPDAAKHDAEGEAVPEGGENTADGGNLDEEAKKAGFTRDPGTGTDETPEKAPEKKD